tara:strand:- start:164 stop:466 length:303 start_codon:yes stop_codon:yes gene_type:complete
MAKKIDEKLLQKERDSLVIDLANARGAVENARNQVQAIQGAIQMTDRLIALSKEGNYSRSRANSDGVPEEKAAEVQKSLEEHAKDYVSQLGDDDRGQVKP